MFNKGEIWAYPTDTSFGLGVRADDKGMLEKLAGLKKRSGGKFFSLMVRDFKMLNKFAEVPKILNEDFLTESPKTVLLKPKNVLPKSPFWPENKVAFRISTIPDVAKKISFPITATSANLSGDAPIFNVEDIEKIWGRIVHISPKFNDLEETPSSEIWDFTIFPIERVR